MSSDQAANPGASTSSLVFDHLNAEFAKMHSLLDRASASVSSQTNDDPNKIRIAAALQTYIGLTRDKLSKAETSLDHPNTPARLVELDNALAIWKTDSHIFESHTNITSDVASTGQSTSTGATPYAGSATNKGFAVHPPPHLRFPLPPRMHKHQVPNPTKPPWLMPEEVEWTAAARVRNMQRSIYHFEETGSMACLAALAAKARASQTFNVHEQAFFRYMAAIMLEAPEDGEVADDNATRREAREKRVVRAFKSMTEVEQESVRDARKFGEAGGEKQIGELICKLAEAEKAKADAEKAKAEAELKLAEHYKQQEEQMLKNVSSEVKALKKQLKKAKKGLQQEGNADHGAGEVMVGPISLTRFTHYLDSGVLGLTTFDKVCQALLLTEIERIEELKEKSEAKGKGKMEE